MDSTPQAEIIETESTTKLVKPSLEFITGIAGTGKTYTIRKRIEENANLTLRLKTDYETKYQPEYQDMSGNEIPLNKKVKLDRRSYGILAATTGIAAVNLGEGVTTINSLFKYYNDESLEDNYASGFLHQILKQLARQTQNIIIDEVSMLSDVALGILYRAFKYVNELQEIQDLGGIGLILIGDFLQLPPIKAKFAFESNHWVHFEENITKLTKVYRQSNAEFLQALSYTREGDGNNAASCLWGLKEITWLPVINSHFDGTTIVATNKECDRLNEVRLDELCRQNKKQEKYNKRIWGKTLQEWSKIPDELTLCESAYVMILSNDTPKFTYVNGDVGNIKALDKGSVIIELKRNKTEVVITPITRKNLVKEHPNGTEKPKFLSKSDWNKLQENGIEDKTYNQYLFEQTRVFKLTHPGEPYFSFIDNKWCVGECVYLPVRLAYATTCHKSQGLTIDTAQIDYSNGFFGQPAMSYVALSRIRSHEGLTIVGNPRVVANRTNVMEEVLRWV